MDILPLHPAGPQPPKLRIAVGGDAGEVFDMLFRAPPDRLEPDDLEAPQPSEPDDFAPHDGKPEAASEPPRLGQDDAPAAAAENPGFRERSNPEGRSDNGGHREAGKRDATGSDGSRAGAVEAAKDGGAGGRGRPAQDAMAARAGRGIVPALRVGATPQSIEPAAPQRAQASGPIVRVTAEQPSSIAPPQRALGGQTALAAQAIAADPTGEPAAPRSAGSGSDAAARIRPTEIVKDSGAAKTATTAKSAEAMQVARAPGATAAGVTLAGPSGLGAGPGAVFADTAGGRPFGLQGLATSTLGQPAPPMTGYAAQAARPAAGPQVAAEQVAVHIRKAVHAGQDRITIKLYPAELGRIDVKMEWADDGVLRAAISVERSETLDLLQRDSRALDRALQEAGLKTDSGSLSFDLRGHAESDGTSRGPGDEPFGGSGSQTQEQAGAEPAPRHRTHDGILDLSV
ncbi:MAG: flagellar hook-length control protein FliK [Planctomycetota bacterium]|jgi:hypothetical protein